MPLRSRSLHDPDDRIQSPDFADAFAGEEVFDVEEVNCSAGNDQQRGHRGHLFDLFLCKGKGQGFLDVGEVVADGLNAGDGDFESVVQDLPDHHHGVVSFFQ